MSDWPAWATEPVHLEPADPEWALRGRVLADRVAELLAPWLAGPVEHVGSTAVPGLPAKPVLDLQAAVRDLADAEAIEPVLAQEGWHYTPPELDARPYRRLFIQVIDGHRTAHLHLMAAGSEHLGARRRFRDRLRADAALRAEYAALKETLASVHADDREAYTEAKGDFVRRISGSD